jgi:hypothetical protein
MEDIIYSTIQTKPDCDTGIQCGYICDSSLNWTDYDRGSCDACPGYRCPPASSIGDFNNNCEYSGQTYSAPCIP